MNRRNFLKVLPALLGCGIVATILPEAITKQKEKPVFVSSAWDPANLSGDASFCTVTNNIGKEWIICENIKV